METLINELLNIGIKARNRFAQLSLIRQKLSHIHKPETSVHNEYSAMVLSVVVDKVIKVESIILSQNTE